MAFGTSQNKRIEGAGNRLSQMELKSSQKLSQSAGLRTEPENDQARFGFTMTIYDEPSALRPGE